ncbi:hypothetical protein BU15DRAFT_78777, partial [Melanogaster broomeanus]
MTLRGTFSVLALAVGLILPTSVLALWPIPTGLSTGMSALKLAPSFKFDVAVSHAPADLTAAVAQARYYLENDKLGRLVVGRGANDTAALKGAKSLPSLKLCLTEGSTVDSISAESVKPL